MSHNRSDDSWEVFQRRFAAYQAMPTWNHWLHPPDRYGVLSPYDMEHMRQKGQHASERLKEAISRLKRDRRFPKRPSEITQRDMARIVKERIIPKPLRDTFWRALIFDRDQYTCSYCRRSVAGVWEESKHVRTISLTCDHCRPKSDGGEDYSLSNTRTACWSCNEIKSTLPENVFPKELQSLARAVLGQSTPAGTAEADAEGDDVKMLRVSRVSVRREDRPRAPDVRPRADE